MIRPCKMSPMRPSKRRRISAVSDYTFEKPGLTSTAQGKYTFKWLLSGITSADFFKNYFEKEPFLRNNPPDKFKQLLSTKIVKDLLEKQVLRHCTDFDITQYSSKEGRKTLNGPEGSKPLDVWKKVLHDGCSLRLLRPQNYCDALWHLCAHLEEFVGCPVGVNAYITPSGNQGFAPHFDDVDAFVCQIEGSKKWRIYNPRADGLDDLPRQSSVDFAQEDMKGMTLWKEVVLNEGDVLYLPRGRIHEAKSVKGSISLHVTVSMFQKWTWADFLLTSFKDAVESASREDRMLRKTLPLRFGEFIGVGCGDQDEKLRAWFTEKVQKIVERVGKLWPTDASGDRMTQRFIKERLPPPPPSGGTSGLGNKKVTLDSQVRARGNGLARVVMGDDGLPLLVHCIENGRDGKERKTGSMSCLPAEALAVDVILRAYPDAVIVGELPLEEESDRVELVEGLIEIGIVQVRGE